MDRGEEFVHYRLIPTVERRFEDNHCLATPALEHAAHLAETLAFAVGPFANYQIYGLATNGRGLAAWGYAKFDPEKSGWDS